MIVIKNRELLIPENEQFIGTVYDNNSDIRYFRIDRLLPGQVDISNFTFVADVKYSNGATDSISLTKETVAEDYLVLRMQIPSTVVAGHAGNMGIQVRGSDIYGRTWSTAPANMYIMDQISNPGAVTASTTLTELQQTETTIEASEALRISAESARATAETGRANAETARVNAESSRVTAEGLRVSAETARASAETGRVSAESSRVSAETSRASAETSRASAETSRASAETSRASAESSRVSAENARVSAENARVIAENGRATAEAAREVAEAAREASLATKSLVSEGWAKGTQNDVPVEEGSPYYHDNSKYHSETSDAKRLVSEGWAKGTQNGVDVGPGSPYYHNNAKYFMEEAGSAPGFVSYVVDQQLNDEAKQIARSNIDAYKKPTGGVPASDMTSAVQTSLGKADTAYQKAATGIPSTDMTTAVQTSLNKADTALQEHQSLAPYRTSANQDVIDATLQPKTDSSLTTTAQTVAGAINEHESDISQLNADKADKMPRYKDITSYFADGTLWDRISGTGYSHPYYDICVGDYLDMGVAVTCPDSTSGTTGSRYVTVASLGGLRCNGDSNVVDFPHLVMIPGQGADGSFHFGRHAMNDSHITTGGYVGSKMHTDVLGAVVSSGSATGTINQQLYNIFGAHLKTTRELLTNSINASGYNRLGTNSGCSNNWEWASCQACLMSEVEVYGSAIWASSGYDTGAAKRQFELFAMDEKTINNRISYYWLKDIVSASRFANVNGNGLAGYNGAGNANDYVRPRFVIA